VTPLLAAFAAATAMWWLMMVAMMTPVTVPWVRAVGTLAPAGGGPASRAMAPALFAAGYAGIWLAFAAAAGALQVGLDAYAAFGPGMALHRPLAGGVLVVAGLYQVTPAKAACLRHCRNPLTFFLTRWRNGPRGALSMGAAHGLFCVGCCWALMGAAFAVGIMSLVWMAVLTAVVCVENLTRWGPQVGRAAGYGALVWGGWMVVTGL
jgi:predicted metal-binding membrane protein